MLSLTIAWRNLWRHRGKSLVVGGILFLGALFMTYGNGTVSGMDEGLRRNVVHGFTGHLVAVPDSQETDNVFLDMMGKSIAPLYHWPKVDSSLRATGLVQNTLPIGRNMAMVLDGEGGNPGFVYLIGVDFAKWQEFFPGNLEVLEGAMPKVGEPGIVVPSGGLGHLFNQMGTWFSPKGSKPDTSVLNDDAKALGAALRIRDSMVLMGYNEANSVNDLRLPVSAVIRYKALNRIWGHFVLLDIESYRRCLGYFAASDAATALSSTDSAVLDASTEDLDAMFSEDGMIGASPSSAPAVASNTPAAAPVASPVDIQSGTWNMGLVLLKPGLVPEDAAQQLTQQMKQAGAGVRLVTWQQATGTIGSMTLIMKAALFLFVVFLFGVAVIIIVNTLSMAALERSSEIGMMRAVGARKGFIARMFLAETAMLALVFGGLGIVFGAIAVLVTPMFGITSSNDMAQLFFGGESFHPVLRISDIVLALIQLAMVTLVAVLYPMRVARSITPLDAIARD